MEDRLTGQQPHRHQSGGEKGMQWKRSSRLAPFSPHPPTPHPHPPRSTHLADDAAPDARQAAGPRKHAILLAQPECHPHLQQPGRAGPGSTVSVATLYRTPTCTHTHASRASAAQPLLLHPPRAAVQVAGLQPVPRAAHCLSACLPACPPACPATHRLVLVHAAGRQGGDQAAGRGAHQLHLAQVKVAVQVEQAAQLPPEEDACGAWG